MSNSPLLPTLLDGTLRRATLVRGDDDYVAQIQLEDGAMEDIECDVLQTTNEKPQLAVGDIVLVWRPAAGERGVILGRIGSGHSSDSVATPDELPDELTLEAKQSLTLRVGQGSITIREDGKILIKGKDLVSHATRMNRIRGGSVSIN